MKLLIVDEVIIAGGMDTLRRQLVPELAKLVDDIVWVLPGYAAGNFREIAEQSGNVAIETLNSPGGIPRIREAVARRLGGEIPRSLVNERLSRLAHGCDVCLTTCVFGQEMPGVDLPIAGYVADINPELPADILNNIGSWVERSSATFGISDFTCAELRRLKPGRPIHSIPLAPGSARPACKGRRGHFFYPAAPNAHKGHLTLLEAARGLAGRGLDYQLTFSGAGMDRDGNAVVGRMRSFLAENRLMMDGRVVIAGDVAAMKVEALFAEASCIVLPSTYEGFGLPLAEALTYGKRVICTDIPPFREQIERHGCDRLATFVPPDDAVALEKAMASHLADGDAPALTAEELRERLGRWTWADAARRCKGLLEGVAGDG